MPVYDCLQQLVDFVHLCTRTYLHVLVCANILVAYVHTCVCVCVVLELFILHHLLLLLSTVINNNRALISWPAALINNIHTFINLNYSQSMQLFIENPPNK